MHHYAVRELIAHDRIDRDVQIVVENELIASVDSYDPARDGSETGSDVFACAIPGHIDMHTHGALGRDTMDASVESLSAIASYHLGTGTTSFLSSTLTAPLGDLRKTLECIGGYKPDNDNRARLGREASILGAHVEGPWISANNSGAHETDYIVEPDNEALGLVDEYRDLIRMVTLSYHTDGAKRLLDALVRHDIIAASGHDEAVDDQILEAFERGLDHVTHIYSNTASFRRKDRYKHLGTLEMALMTPGVTIEVIADGKHITWAFWKFLRHNKDVTDIVLVTDSTLGAGMPEDPDKTYLLGGREIIVDDGVAWVADRTVFAGSTATMHGMFRRLVLEWRESPQNAVRMTSWNPARRLGLENKLGRITAGARADFLLLDDAYNIRRIIKSGVEVDPT